jgi:hypothetical protein
VLLCKTVVNGFVENVGEYWGLEQLRHGKGNSDPGNNAPVGYLLRRKGELVLNQDNPNVRVRVLLREPAHDLEDLAGTSAHDGDPDLQRRRPTSG